MDNSVQGTREAVARQCYSQSRLFTALSEQDGIDHFDRVQPETGAADFGLNKPGPPYRQCNSTAVVGSIHAFTDCKEVGDLGLPEDMACLCYT
jgi:hypothetical protein